MPQKKNAKERREAKRKKQGLVVAEVARATNEGQIPTSQQDIREAISNRYGISIAPSTLTVYVQALAEENLGRRWLRTDGWDVYLAESQSILTDSTAIDALHTAHKLRDENGDFSKQKWAQRCLKEIRGITMEDCGNYLGEYYNCGYLMTDSYENEEIVKLDIATYNRDLFYLKVAGAAKLKKFNRKKKR